MGKYFGTDGVRGIANVELTNELAHDLGRYGAYVLTQQKNGEKATLLIGKDPRISSYMLENALIAGILSVGCDVVQVGVVPTPAVSYLVRKHGFDAGVMISASHNSFEYNGIKFFNSEGLKLSDALEDEIESYLEGAKKMEKSFSHGELGRYQRDRHMGLDYLENAIQTVAGDLSGVKILLDCANGATFELAGEAYRRLGADVTVINHEPDGININDGCGSTHLGQLKQAVVEGGYDVGLAFDGDGDRVLAVDSDGQEFDGDKIMLVIAGELKKKGKLKDNTIVATVMSNLGFMNYAKEHGFNVEITKVGDRYVLERMLEKGYSLGGEQSGHVIELIYNKTGDGILTGLSLLEAIKASGKSMKEWNQEIPRYPQVIVNAKVNREKQPLFDKLEKVNERIKEVDQSLGDKGRVLIRPSGTEPLIRVMLEGEDGSTLQALAEEIAGMYEKELS